MKRVVFYTKENCLLCEEVDVLLEMYAAMYSFIIERRDIYTNDDWLEAYHLTIPVVEIADEQIMSPDINSETLSQFLESHFLNE